MSVFKKLTRTQRDYVDQLHPGKNYKYIAVKSKKYHSKRYNKSVTVDKGMLSDGATGAFDIDSDGWGFHDKLCDTGKFDDGTLCTNWQASVILSDILFSEWSIKKPLRLVRAITWLPATLLLGGGKCRENGIFTI